MDFDRRARVELDLPPGQKPSPEVVLRQVQARLEKTMFRLWVQLDRPGNALSIRAAGVGAVRVYVPEGLLDLSRLVTLRFGSATWRGTIAPSAECILKHYARTRDGSALVVNEVDLDERGRVVVGFAPSPASAPGK